MLPSLSIVMPVFNGVAFVRRAVDAVLAQSFRNWELLAVDDGSTDGSGTLLEDAARDEPRIRVFRHDANRGQAAARNTAIAEARGAWLAYLDCDDEFYPDHFDHIAEWQDRGEVLVFRYDLVEERIENPDCGRVTTYEPASHLEALVTDILAVPLGVVHPRSLLERTGGFDESLGWRQGAFEDADLWRRFARAGALFAFVPHKSGRYHVRSDSLARTRPPSPSPHLAQETAEPITLRISSATAGGVPTAVRIGVPRAVTTRSKPPRVLFASYHCYHDMASGAAICTRDLFTALAARGWRCGAFTGPVRDDPAAPPISELVRTQPGARTAPGTAAGVAFTLHIWEGQGGFPVTICAPDAPSGPWPSEPEAAAFLAMFEQILGRFKPDIVLTYGGDRASAGIAAAARRAGIRVAFWLHNFAYPDAKSFAGCDAVIVPSEFSRAHHRARLGIECAALPPVIHISRVIVERPGNGSCLTFVNPMPEKGVFAFARVAQILGQSRPDISLLVVEGRGRTDWLGRCGVNLGAVSSFQRMPNTPDPRQFYRLSRMILMPSVWLHR